MFKILLNKNNLQGVFALKMPECWYTGSNDQR